MLCRKGVSVVVATMSMFLTTTTLAQESNRSEPRANDIQNQETVSATADNKEATEPSTADGWLDALLESTVERNAKRAAHRLCDYHLTRDQVQQLIAAADREKSDFKRVMYWHAIRLSQDSAGRDYLIRTLVEKCSLEMQIQFIEELRNPSRFDLAILAALYNSHRFHHQNLRSQADIEPADLDAGKAQGVDSRPVFGDLFDVSLKIVELTCLTDWATTLTENTDLPFQYDENTPEEVKAKATAGSRKKSQDARLAQEEMVHWLIRNGFTDIHRFSGFQKYLATRGEGARKPNVHYGYEFIDSFKDPEIRAKAVRYYSADINPGRFLAADEAEDVRLGAIESMYRKILDSRGSQNTQFVETISRFKPILKLVQRTDASPKVRESAQRLQKTIADYEKYDAQTVGRAIQ